MRTTASYLRIIGFIAIAFFLFEIIADAGEQWALEKYPILWAVLGVVLVFSIAVELIVEALQNILFKGLSDEAKARYVAEEVVKKKNQFSWIKRKYSNLLGSKPIQEEHEIILDHNYDGIKELDNKLPPWWVYSFYASIVFAVVYMARYHIFDDINQDEEYDLAVAEAQIEIENYKKTAKNLVDVNTVVVLTDPADITAGKNIFTQNCIACHKADGGGGIGPNLTDNYWILGGGIKKVFNTISEGGRDGKGMVSWKSDLTPLEMAQVSSYVLQFKGTTPAEPKDPEGDIWVDPDAPEQAVLKVNDSTAVIVPGDN
ncbi:cbb3-type cytochrome c oxidase N-terminal domain-containing protein [Rasiella sp. SM2506]|uniref:cbb3-type cytochrome c oxidase N-terminal domain-containing protein n=1 Tax=Rasiella sp. SM2506 TaxID=3423914 RepID=UPI003D78D330